MKTRILILLAALLVFSAFAEAQTSYVAEIEKWRASREAEIGSENGWLTVAGLFWLKEGANTVGAGSEFDVELTENFRQGKFGTIDYRGGQAILKIENGVETLIDGKQIAGEIKLAADDKGKPTVVQTGSQTFYIIARENRLGVRLKDKNSRARVEFSGLKWFPVNEKYRVEANFEAFAEPKEVLIPNVLGGVFKMKSPGVLRFKLNGKSFALEPVLEEGSNELFIIFRDLTSKSETYGAGRFLYAKKAENGKVILDFNKAENPPCAFTPFATCPLPPPQNRLNAEIKAGEKRYSDH